MPNGLIFITALVPTKGHQYLIEFADQFMRNVSGELHVILSCRSKEPVPGYKRISAFQRQNESKFVHFHLHADDNAPQNPGDVEHFWEYWRQVAINFIGREAEYVFASEPYGIDVAKSMSAKFIPCDIQRQTLNMKSTDIRNNLVQNFSDILPEFQHYIKQTVTFFGAESCGKTTMANYFNYVQKLTPSYKVPEWAREYLETVGPELTEEKMLDIVHGQYAAQIAVDRMKDRPYVFRDTDLLSTIGYYRIINMKIPPILLSLFEKSKSDLYIVMNSNIPFEQDALRYGGNIRQSTDQFWIDLLEEFHCNYYVVKETERQNQLDEIYDQLNNLWKKFDNVKDFIRE